LSDQRLLFLPDRLFSIGVERQIISLNLRRNSLVLRPNNEIRTPPLGWLDDVHRLSSLRSLNIADNSLQSFPLAVTRLISLTELVLSGNRIAEIPPQIGLLSSLCILNLSNNWLISLPMELAECCALSTLDLSFNRFEQIPDVIFSLKRLLLIQLAGNEVSSSSLHTLSGVHAHKLDLRRNALKRSIRLTSFIFDALCEVDVRDNTNLSELDFSNLPTLQIVHCERIGLNSLQINGSSLRYLYADHNDLSQAIIMPIPIHLIVFCIPYNRLVSLPDWITDLPQVETISAHHNSIRRLPYRIFMNVASLKNLFLNDNDIERLPEVIENCSLEVLSLHNNHIEQLPLDLLRCAHKLRNLNVSNNRLPSLPVANPVVDLNRLQLLRAASNRIDESVIPTVVSCRRLRLLDLSYNQLRFFDDSCLMRLTALEEVNLSSNRLTSVSPAFGMLPNLQILRLHSNLITSMPDLSHSPSLFLIDISSNELENLNTDMCMAKTLKHLDLTYNAALRVDTSRIHPKRYGRLVSIVDVGSESTLGPFHFGFSETAGQRNKLCIRQIRPKNGNQFVFGMVDGGYNHEIPSLIVEKLNDYVQQKVIVGASSLKAALIRAHERLGQMGERLGASALLLHVSRQQLLCASSGHVRAVLCRNGDACDITGDLNKVLTEEEYHRIRRGNATITQDNIIEGVCHSSRSLGFSFLYPAVVPNPVKITVPLLESDEFIIIGSRALWKFLSPQQGVDLIRAIHNPQIAAKKLQDTVQSLEYSGNLSVIVVRFTRCINEMKESRNIVRRTQIAVNYNKEELSFSDGEVPNRGESTLRSIEERLEQISEAISKIEDDSNNNRSIENGIDQIDVIDKDHSFRRPVRRTKHRSVDTSRASIGSGPSFLSRGSQVDLTTTIPSRAASAASAPPDPQTSDTSHLDTVVQHDSNRERFSIRSRIDMFDRMSGLGTVASRERFQRARLALGEQLRLETPSERGTRQYLL
uniref:PPM-type phosphatase domain-containing protein n=1 Tax=Parascaris univalens TaxID=6257 RepID=A0A915BNH5_PARUN